MPINSLVLDAGPLILQSFTSIQTLAERFYTTPSVYNEIKDETARQNLVLWGDSLNVRQPRATSVQFVSEFAKKTGDYAVLSTTDIQVIALCYELDLELNNGDDSRLRKIPAPISSQGPSQKTVIKKNSIENEDDNEEDSADQKEPENEPNDDDGWSTVTKKNKNKNRNRNRNNPPKNVGDQHTGSEGAISGLVSKVSALKVTEETKEPIEQKHKNKNKHKDEDDDSLLADYDSEDDEDGEWITSANLTSSLEKNGGDVLYDKTPLSSSSSSANDNDSPVTKAAMSTGDFAMQNVALQIGLNLVNPSNGLRIKKVRNYMLRCHGCFKLIPFPRDGKPLHFCPRCGGNTLMRCSVSVGEDGVIQVHLKKNMQWWHKGDVYSLPSPQSRKARQTRHNDNTLLLRADQPEYEKSIKEDLWRRRNHERMLENWVGSGSADNVMSPFAISGYKRDSSTLKSGVKVGTSRYVNSPKTKRK